MTTYASRIEEVRERFHRSAFHHDWVGMALDRVETGEVDVGLDLAAHHLNLVGLVHGGLIAILADTATGLAYRTVLESGSDHVTTQLNVTFVAPARRGRLVARGRVIKAGRRFGYAESDVVDGDGRLVARATATFAVMPERPQ